MSNVDKSEIGRQLQALRKHKRGGFSDPAVVQKALETRRRNAAARKSEEATDAAPSA